MSPLCFEKLPVLEKVEYEVMHETRYIRFWLVDAKRWITATDLDNKILREGDGIYQTPELDCAYMSADSYVRLWKRAGLAVPDFCLVGVSWSGEPAWRTLCVKGIKKASSGGLTLL